jgi:hypothetical protein
MVFNGFDFVFVITKISQRSGPRRGKTIVAGREKKEKKMMSDKKKREKEGSTLHRRECYAVNKKSDVAVKKNNTKKERKGYLNIPR